MNDVAISAARLDRKVKTTRAPNEIDFWRGIALVSIFMNHIPGLWYEKFTHKNFGYTDSAELFVLLAGWSLRILVDSQPRSLTPLRLSLRLGGRAVSLYAAQLVITTIAIALTATAALMLDNALILQWNNTAAVFEEPVTAHIGIVILSHQLGYFDILPLYVVLMMMGPIIGLIYRYVPAALLPLSLAIWAATLTFGVNIPTWPVEGRWYFNPLAWQLIFVTGFVLGGAGAVKSSIERWRLPIRVLGGIIVIVGYIGTVQLWFPEPLEVPEPFLFFVADKTFLTPLRYFHALGLVAFFGGSFWLLIKYLRPICRFFSMLGRNSLYVFCIGSLLSLSGQIVRFAIAPSLLIDTIVVIVGISAMSATAWVSEWRTRLRD
jgi:hypothetical protein